MTDQVVDTWDMKTCPKCKGKGEIFAFRHMLNKGKCFMCKGAGYITTEEYQKITNADPEDQKRKLMNRVYALPVVYKDDPRIKARGMHPTFAIETLRNEDGITTDHVDDVIEVLMEKYKEDPRSEESKFGGRLYAREVFVLAKQDGILDGLLKPSETPEIDENPQLCPVIPEFEDSSKSALLLDDDEVIL